MATSSVSSNSGTSTAADIQAANKAAAQRLLTSLSAGSGVDVASLAQNLVDAERIPKENAINAKIAKNDNKVSGLAAVKFMLDEFKTRLSELKDKSSYNSLAASNSNTSALNITTSNAATAGSYSINISSLAKPQRSISSTGFASATTPINGGLPFDLTLGSSRAGVSTGTTTNLPVHIARIQAPSFGTTPTVTDFTEFKVTVAGVAQTFTPNPASATLADLAADLNTQLNAYDNTLSVTVDSGNLVISSTDLSKRISAVSLTADPAAAGVDDGTPVNPPFPTFMASLSGVSFGTAASTTDFKNFPLTVDGKVLSFRPRPADTSLTALAADIQKQLRGVDGTDELTVTVSGTTLNFSSSGVISRLVV